MARKQQPDSRSVASSKESAAMKRILVTGDVLHDCNIYMGKRLAPGSKGALGTKVIYSRGGAGLLYDIIKELVKRKNVGDHNDTCQYAAEFDLDLEQIDKLNIHLHFGSRVQKKRVPKNMFGV